MKIKEGGVMDINKEREAFEKECRLLCYKGNMVMSNLGGFYNNEQTNWMWQMWLSSKAQSDKKIKLLLCDEHLQKCESPTGVFNSQYPDEEPCLICLAKEAKAQAVPEGFVLVSAEQLSQWGHMANYAEQYGCPECFEARGYAHNLGCEINAYFNVSEAKEPAND